MSEEFQKVLFDPFTQEHRNDNSEMRGTGLGLAIVQRIITAMSSYLRTENSRIICTRLQYSWLENPGGDILVVRSDVTEAYEKEQEQIRLLEQEKHGIPSRR